MEKFLEFWSHYNATIIEGLVALILLSVIYLAYRTFFGSKGTEAADSSHVGGATVDTEKIEKTLQKILEQQTAAKASSSSNAASNSKATSVATASSSSSSPASAELIHEVAHLKQSVEEKEKLIVKLQDQLEAAKSAAPLSASVSAPSEAGAGGPSLSDADRANYEARIKELEAKLAEYEIISEDIADVSFFKEENARLNSELTALKAGSAAPQAAPQAAAPVAASAAPAAESVPTPAESVAAAPTEQAVDPALIAELSAQDPSAPAAPAADAGASTEASNAIDDSLMAEFAKAVEGQKEGTLEKPEATSEDNKLLEEFENFSKKG